MKPKHEYKAEQCLDIISTLPQPILEIILCILPTKEAARTSILSKDWRHKWKKIPKLEFNHDGCTWKNMDMKCKHFYDIHQVISLHQSSIQNLSIHTCLDCDPFGLDQIILYLAKNHTVKELALCGWDFDCLFDLPISFFSLHHLTDLSLSCVDIEHEPVFNGFGSNLKSLVLQDVGISTKTLLDLLSNCSSLNRLSLMLVEEYIGGNDCTVIELFNSLPVIEHLTTWYYTHKLLVLDSVPQKLPALLFHLKYFCLKYLCCVNDCGLAFLLILIKCSPNLQKIKLEMDSNYECHLENSFVWEEYSDVWLEHLNEIEIEGFRNLKPEMDFVKFIMAKSPKLKKVKFIRSLIYEKAKLETLEVLLQAPRASTVRIYV